MFHLVVNVTDREVHAFMSFLLSKGIKSNKTKTTENIPIRYIAYTTGLKPQNSKTVLIFQTCLVCNN